MNKFKKEFYQKLDNLENKINKLENKTTNLENELVEEKLSKNTTNQGFVFVNSAPEYSPTIGEQYKDDIYEYTYNAHKFNVGYIKAINFLTSFEPSCIASIKLRAEMMDKKIGDLKRSEIENLAPKEKSIDGSSDCTMLETTVSKVLFQPFDFSPEWVIRVAEYVKEVQDFDYKVSKYAEFEDYEEE